MFFFYMSNQTQPDIFFGLYCFDICTPDGTWTRDLKIENLAS